MTEIYTPEILLQYIYNETDHILSNKIKVELKNNVSLLETYNQLLDSVNILDSAKHAMKMQKLRSAVKI